jgi:hypothetical protein
MTQRLANAPLTEEDTSVISARREYARLKPLATLDAKQRGWTLDVLNGIRSLGKKHFDLEFEATAIELAQRRTIRPPESQPHFHSLPTTIVTEPSSNFYPSKTRN